MRELVVHIDIEQIIIIHERQQKAVNTTVRIVN